MTSPPIRVLCIEDNPGDVMLVRIALAGTGSSFVIEWADRLSRGLEMLAREAADAVLLDLGLPDSHGLDTLSRVRAEAPGAPVVVLTGLDDDPSEIKALTAGAQDYLSKDRLEGDVLARAIRHAIERSHLLASERAARAEAERANLAKDIVLATISHELRNPLQTILGWTQFLQEDAEMDLTEKQRALSIIERCALQQGRLIEDLLDASRAVTDTMRIDRNRVRILDVVRGALDVVEHSARAKGVHMVLEVGCVDEEVLGDTERLQQVVGNLLGNAIKFTPEGGRVSVRADRLGEFARVVVEDTGVGIPAEFLPHVFERFRSGAYASRDARRGLGLGLAIAQHIVNLHGGTITVASPGPGRGARFVVDLPLAESTREAHAR